MTKKCRLLRCDFLASFRHPPSGPQVLFSCVVVFVSSMNRLFVFVVSFCLCVCLFSLFDDYVVVVSSSFMDI